MTIAKAGYGTILILLAMLLFPLTVAGQDVEKKGDPQVQPRQNLDAEGVAVDATLKRALEKSEADRVDLEKKYLEMTERERQAREQLGKLAAEKEALLKGCPPKEAGKETDAKPAAQAGKKKKVGRLKSVRKKEIETVALVSEENAKPETKIVKRRGKVKRSSAVAGKKPAATAGKSCGAKIGLSAVTKALKKGRDLSGKNLNGLNLAGMDFTGVNLSGACLVGADMGRSNFQEANLERADMTGANLRMASFRLANLNDVVLEKAVLDGAIWSDSRICLSGSVGKCRDVIQ